MARDATARLYDVQEDSVVLKKYREKKKYDQGAITFRAKKGKLIDLDKLHESIWATRLSVGTRSGLLSLEVTAVGGVVIDESETIIRVAGSKAYFVLARNSDKDHEDAFDKLREAVKSGRKVVAVTGRVDGWAGRWTSVLRKLPPKPRRILVTSFTTAKVQTAKVETAKQREPTERSQLKNKQ